jgi:hypothetical protein
VNRDSKNRNTRNSLPAKAHSFLQSSRFARGSYSYFTPLHTTILIPFVQVIKSSLDLFSSTNLPYVNSTPSSSHDNCSSARDSTDLLATALARAFTIRQQRAYNTSALFFSPPPSADPCESLRIYEKCSITFPSGQAPFKTFARLSTIQMHQMRLHVPFEYHPLHKHVRGCRRPKKTEDIDKSVEKQEDRERLSEEATHKKN